MKLTSGDITVNGGERGRDLSQTMGLRWSSDGLLQQAWIDLNTGDVKWCDVPVEIAAVAGRTTLKEKRT